MRYLSLPAFFLLLFGFASAASVDSVTLASLLGANATIEEFDQFDFDQFGALPGDSVSGFVSVLDSTTTFRGQGPGLISEDLRVTAVGVFNSLSWNDAGFDDLSNESMMGFNGQTLRLDFLDSTNAVGINLNALLGSPEVVIANVFDDNGALIGTETLGVVRPAGSFFGFASAEGISRIELSNTVNTWTPVIESVQFGFSDQVTPIPEPSSLAALAIVAIGGVASRRRR